jgi:FtsH-binding integral membrane protein
MEFNQYLQKVHNLTFLMFFSTFCLGKFFSWFEVVNTNEFICIIIGFILTVYGIYQNINSPIFDLKNKRNSVMFICIGEGLTIGPLIYIVDTYDTILIPIAIILTIIVFGSCVFVSKFIKISNVVGHHIMNMFTIVLILQCIYIFCILMGFKEYGEYINTGETYIGIGVFMVVLIYDYEKAKNDFYNGDKDYYVTSVNIYLDLLNIFIRILNLIIKYNKSQKD